MIFCNQQSIFADLCSLLFVFSSVSVSDHISFCAQGTSGKADSEGSDTSERTSQGIVKYVFKEVFNVFKRETSKVIVKTILLPSS